MLLHRINGNVPLVVKPTFVTVIAWLCLAFFLFCTVMSIRAGQGEASPIFILFVMMSVYMLLASGPLVMDAHTIIYRTRWARYQIRWDEVTHIEIDQQGGGIVFCGEGKRLAALGPMYWGGSDKAEMLALLANQIERKQIEVRGTQKALFRLSKATKV